MQELNTMEIDQVSGAVNGVEIAGGVIAVGGAVLAVAALPAIVSFGVVLAALSVSGAGGYLIGNGIMN